MASYYEYLAPLTPISPPDFRSPATHPSFLNEEPLLAVTVLTVASRYKQLSGPGGESRSYMVHERLWSYLQNMITRMFWGQEQFGGGFCGGGTRRPKTAIKGGLRTLGTIESLLLLSEFHPRSMHFPPGDDGDDILTTAEEDYGLSSLDENNKEMPSFGEATVMGWSEPALRSDRMCWSLIGMSQTLAYELGVFGNFQNGIRVPRPRERQGVQNLSSYEKRVDRIERLLYVYINSACGRFGFPPMYAGQDEDLDLRNVEARMLAGLSAKDPVDVIQECWADITWIMKACNAILFPSRDHTQALIKTGSYMALLEQLQPITISFGQRLDATRIPKYPRIILSIELEYIRLYIFSLALQAVLEHWTSNVAPTNEDPMPNNSFSELYRQNEIYIAEVVKAARNLLRLVVDGLLPGGYLKHAPVRTHFRILSGAMFLLKTFTIGTKEDEVNISLDLLDRTVQALRTSVVDDVHLCLRIADLLEGLTSNIRHKFVRLPARNAVSNAASPINQTRASPSANLPSYNGSLQPPSNPNFSQQYHYERSKSPAATALSSNYDSNNNISIMPPPSSTYQYNGSSNINNAYAGSNNNFYSNNNALSPFNNTEEDWLTLDLNPLLSSDSTAFQLGVGDGGQWFGNFGPEINGNLEVLGKLVEGWETAGLTGGST
ncbi:MAG: hypothetical protein Q9220_005287 [cf. Caloplaca sp. 1 TL-2023]